MKKLSLSIAFALVATSAAAEDLTIRWGVDPTFAPFESKDPDGKLIGFDIDLGNAICTQLKAKCSWVETSFDGIIPALKAKKFDGVLSAMTINEQRKQQIAFSDKIYASPTRLIAPKGSALRPTVDSLKGKRIGVAQGTTQEAFTKAYWQPKGVIVVSYQNQELVYPDLLTGRLDASITDAVVADIGFLKTTKGRGFEFAGDTIKDYKTLGSGVAIGLRKEDQALRQAINSALASILKNGTYQKLANKYFSFDIYKD